MLNVSKETIMPLFQRLAELVENGDTARAPDIMKVPLRNYSDLGRWQREVTSIYLRRPLVVSLSCELRQPGSYRAFDLMGVPILLTRDKDGEIRAFINSCRHRGLPVVKNGSGNAPRFTCLYHGWTYAQDGRLLAVSNEDSFGKVDKSCYGLTPLAVAERAGFIFAILTPGIPLDLDAWLGDFGPLLDEVGFEDFELYSVEELESPNWKIVWEGYSETYHFPTLHPDSFSTNQLANTMLADPFGPHQRLCVPRRGIDEHARRPEEEIRAADYITTSFQIFPTTQLSFAFIGDADQVTPGVQAFVAQVFPHEEPGRSRTVIRILTKGNIVGTDAEPATQVFAKETVRTIRDEDYAAIWQIQRTLKAGGMDHLLLGRNEPALQHFHRSVDKFVTEDANLNI